MYTPILTLSDYSDLANVSSQTRDSWEGEIAIRQKYWNYFTGLIFNSKVPLDTGTDENAPELYPVGLNLVKMFCTTMADSIFGEWEDRVISFEPRQDVPVEQPEKDATALAASIMDDSQANSMLWELDLDREVYGGGVLKISPAPSLPSHIKWSHIPLDSFFPIWDPDDSDKLLEVYIVIPMTKEQVLAKYGIQSSKDIAYRVEHWTTKIYENKVDGKRIDVYSGLNPWGFVPFEFIPRIRSTHWWGDSLTEELIRVQDELNMRIADLGEAVNYNTHPIKWGFNLPKTFNPKNYPVGPNYFWDAGRVIGNSPVPQISILEAKNPIPQGTFDYISFLYDWGKTSTFTPPVALGQEGSGSSPSGITLEIRLWTMIKAIKRSRSYLGDGLMRAMKKSALILKQMAPSDVSSRALTAIIKGEITPHFAPIMPRDQASIVDEIQKGMSTKPQTVSLETAVKKLGYGTSEVDRIKDMLGDDSLFVRDEKMQALKDQLTQAKTIGKNSATGAAPDKPATPKPGVG